MTKEKYLALRAFCEEAASIYLAIHSANSIREEAVARDKFETLLSPENIEEIVLEHLPDALDIIEEKFQ